MKKGDLLQSVLWLLVAACLFLFGVIRALS